MSYDFFKSGGYNGLRCISCQKVIVRQFRHYGAGIHITEDAFVNLQEHSIICSGKILVLSLSEEKPETD